MLGHKLYQVLGKEFEAFGTVRGEYSQVITFGIFDRERIFANVQAENPDSVRQAIDRIRPDVVINAIGLVKQLPNANDVVSALTINSIFPHQVARFAAEYGFRFITLSTDCVFAGSKGYYIESDVPDAADLYGRSKQLGELTEGNVLTLRTSIIGRELTSTHGLLEWFLSQHYKVNGFAGTYFSGLPTIIIAELIAKLVREVPDLTGLFHVSGERISKYELLTKIRDRVRTEVAITPVDEPRLDRSLDSSRFREATGYVPLGWDEMVDRIFLDQTPYDDIRRI
jgi:dTDP-4-dehydrorhamnose reductase